MRCFHSNCSTLLTVKCFASFILDCKSSANLALLLMNLWRLPRPEQVCGRAIAWQASTVWRCGTRRPTPSRAQASFCVSMGVPGCLRSLQVPARVVPCEFLLRLAEEARAVVIQDFRMHWTPLQSHYSVFWQIT
jgi:hypothetical protein